MIVTCKENKDSVTYLQLDYTYDILSNVTNREITRKNGLTKNYNYTYDVLNRLVRVEIDGRLYARYEYDAVGNRLLKEFALFEPSSVGGVGGVDFGLNNEGKYATITYNYNADNELLSASDTRFEFDKNGNMTAKIDPEKGRTEYTYNRADRLYKITSPDGAETKFYYDARGLRYKKVDHNGAETLFYYGSGSIPPLLSERLKTPGSSGDSGDNGEKLASYLPGMSAIRTSPFASGSTPPAFQPGVYHNFYHLTDHLGSVYYLTDESGKIVTEYDYDEFGIVLKQNSKTTIPPYNPTGYTGEPQHNEPAGLVYLRNRFYEPYIGAFTQPDSLFYTRSYSYVDNNPMIFQDKLGLLRTFNDDENKMLHEALSTIAYVYGDGAVEQFRQRLENGKIYIEGSLKKHQLGQVINGIIRLNEVFFMTRDDSAQAFFYRALLAMTLIHEEVHANGVTNEFFARSAGLDFMVALYKKVSNDPNQPKWKAEKLKKYIEMYINVNAVCP